MPEGKSVADMVRELNDIQHRPKKCQVCRLIFLLSLVVFVGVLALKFILIDQKVAIKAATKMQLAPVHQVDAVSPQEFNTKMNEFSDSVRKAQQSGESVVVVHYTTPGGPVPSPQVDAATTVTADSSGSTSLSRP